MRRIRIMPRTFDCDWRADLLSVGVRIPNKISTLQYTPVNHNPMPFSLDVDLTTMRLLKRTIGVMPNALYQGHIYTWDEFCKLIEEEKKGKQDDRK